GEDFALKDKDVSDVARKLSMVWNMYDFFTMYAEVDGWEYEPAISTTEDDRFVKASEKNPKNVTHRVSARTILFDDTGRVGLIYCKPGDFYILPGGGVDENEGLESAAQRETLEETGHKSEIIKYLGRAIDRYVDSGDNTINDNIHHYYVAKSGELVGRNLTEDEARRSFEFVWVDNIETAISLFERAIASKVKRDEPQVVDVIEKRDLSVLNYYQNGGKAALTEPQNLKNPLDKWVISRLHQTAQHVEKHLDEYNIPEACSEILPFLDDASNWFVRRSRRRFWKSEDDGDKAQAYATLHYVLAYFALIIAPFCPFMAEELWQKMMVGGADDDIPAPTETKSAAAVLLVRKDGAIILQHRDEKKGIYQSGLTSVFGGGIEKGELPANAALREISEETNLKLNESDLEYFGKYREREERDASLPIQEWDNFVFMARDLDDFGLEVYEGQGFEVIKSEKDFETKRVSDVARRVIRDFWNDKGVTGLSIKNSVHLQDWPAIGTIDEKVLGEMAQTRAIIEKGLAQRMERGDEFGQIKVRQPLAKLTYTGDKLDDFYEQIIAEEVNVKNVIASGAKQSSQNGSGLPRQTSLPRNDGVANDGAVVDVMLDKKITPELRREGWAREVIRVIQNARKDAKLNVDDRIIVSLSTSDKSLNQAITDFRDEIARECLIAKFAENDGEQTRVKIDDMEITIKLKRGQNE
ncbi:MAG: NUDIX domain-containing protein, partial [Candidatus Nomurabacteria bacterium]|nr:NUDIX domain-containing protein [Candidatus Nomurabacteria bacterium]